MVGGLALAAAAGLATSAQADSVQVKVTNLAPDQGVYLTPVFTAFHDGGFDMYDRGDASVSSGFERLVEDGSTQFLNNEFQAGGHGTVSGALPGGLGTFPPPGVLGPGQSSSKTFDLDPNAPTSRYFSYASMVIPSNDAFVANDTPTRYRVFDANGDFTGPFSITVIGDAVLDAGTEANTETKAAFLNQMKADAGTATPNQTVRLHPGFNGSQRNPDGTPMNILGGTNPMGVHFDATPADFTRPGYEVLRIDVTSPAASVVPAPAAAWMGLGLLGMVGLSRATGRSRRCRT